MKARYKFLLVCWAVLCTLLVATPAYAPPVAIGVAVAAVVVGAAAAGAISVVTAVLVVASVAFSLISAALKPSPQQQNPTSTDSAVSTASGSKVTIDQKQNVRQATAPRRLIYGEARVGGVFGFMSSIDNNQTLGLTLLLAGHQCVSVESILFDDITLAIDGDGYVRTDPWNGWASFWVHLGAPGQQADAYLLARFPEWNTTRRGEGICYLTAQLHWDHDTPPGDVGAKIWTGGIPNITAIVKGKICYDPRWGGWAWTENAALCVADYLTDKVYGIGVDWATGINLEALIVAANTCDELVLLADGTNWEPRYTLNGSFLSDAQPDEILARMLSAMFGKAIYDGAQWTILAGAYHPPAIVLTDDDMVDPSIVQTLRSARDSFNGVKGTYIEPKTGWNGTDFPAVKSATFAALDGRERLKDVELPFTISVSMAQRLAKIDLLRSRQEIAETFIGRMACWQLRTGDTVLRTSERYGWDRKLFEVSSVRFVVRDSGGEGQAGSLAVQLQLLELAPNVYDWSTSDETTVDPAPNTNFPDIFNVGTPGKVTWREAQYVSREAGGVKSELIVSWEASRDAFVTGYQLQYQRIDTVPPVPGQSPLTLNTGPPDNLTATGGNRLIVRPRVNGLTDTILDIAPGTYSLAVAAINWANIKGTTFSTATAVVYGLSAPPETPQNLTLTTMGGFCFLRWDAPTELDVLVGGSTVIRFSTSQGNPTWQEGVTLSKPLPGNDTFAAVPARIGTYMVKFYDSTGNSSIVPATVLGFQNSVLDFVGLGEAIEEPTFAGSKTNIAYDPATHTIELVGPPGILIDAVPDIDALSSFDNYAAGYPPGVYLFANSIDLGAITRCRLTSFLVSVVFSANDLIDMRGNLIDDWSTFDDIATGDEADGVIYVRWTDFNPAAGLWSAWQRLDSAEFENRAFQFKLELTRTDENVSIEVSGAGVVAEQVTP